MPFCSVFFCFVSQLQLSHLSHFFLSLSLSLPTPLFLSLSLWLRSSSSSSFLRSCLFLLGVAIYLTIAAQSGRKHQKYHVARQKFEYHNGRDHDKIAWTKTMRRQLYDRTYGNSARCRFLHYACQRTVAP